MSGEAMVLSPIQKINNKLQILYHKNLFLTPKLTLLLFNALILITHILPGIQI